MLQHLACVYVADRLAIEIGVDGIFIQYLEAQIKQLRRAVLPQNWIQFSERISARLSWNIYGVNLICGGLFSAGLVRYCRSKPYPLARACLAFPYLGIVVAMGYSARV